MKKILPFLILVLILTIIPPGGSSANTAVIQLGSDVLFTQFHQMIEDKKVGLLTNQTGVNGSGISTIDMIRRDRSVSLKALFTPEYGLDGRSLAEDANPSYLHPVYGVPVYSLSAPSPQLPNSVIDSLDLLLVDVQHTGNRHDSILSTLKQVILLAKEHHKPLLVLDHPNPLGGINVDGPVLEEGFLSPSGVDTIPLTHGMTIGELALFFNRQIGADVSVVPMAGYTRSMSFQETRLSWIKPSPQFPDLGSTMRYLAASLGEGTNIRHADHYSWIGGPGIDSVQYADMLNGSLLPGVVFFPEDRDTDGGVRMQIMDPRLFNPAKTGIYVLAYAQQLSHFPIPKKGSDAKTSDFDLRMGTDKIGALLESEKSPQEIEAEYAPQLAQFLSLRSPYLIYNEQPFFPTAPISIHLPAVPTAPTGEEPKNPEPPAVQPPQGKPKEEPANPNQPKIPPTVPAPAEQQPVPAASEKVAYLTFDDGPSQVTPEILETLKKYDAKATFFIVGRNVPGNEEILKRIIEEGHAVGGHTYSHDYRLLYKSKDAFFADLEKGNALIEQATGIKLTLFRYPGGSTNTVSLHYQDPKLYNKQQNVMTAIKEESNKRGYVFIDWNVTNGDARSNKYTAADAFAQIKQQVKQQKEIVVLMHDSSTKAATAQSLPHVIEFLQEKGYRFASIPTDRHIISTVK
ncbi:exo-beta-N-acetylmuramidase NamZ domain-containing protein [Brevibacillus panacihumi]|uniref:exo-beta-N-acetylmuramidase NamZ domain-containing protein n=1 Tax=Brevibacillus panacihumi TaxID=497735 RepID=UPI003D0825CC